MKHQLSISAISVVALGLAACPKHGDPKAAAPANESPKVAAVAAEHPDLTEDEQYIPCHECHREDTPEIVTAWFDSTHGIANVKCYQCHGTYENLFRVPEQDMACGSCHAETLGEHTKGQSCWSCHPAHDFRLVEGEGSQK